MVASIIADQESHRRNGTESGLEVHERERLALSVLRRGEEVKMGTKNNPGDEPLPREAARRTKSQGEIVTWKPKH